MDLPSMREAQAQPERWRGPGAALHQTVRSALTIGCRLVSSA